MYEICRSCPSDTVFFFRACFSRRRGSFPAGHSQRVECRALCGRAFRSGLCGWRRAAARLFTPGHVVGDGRKLYFTDRQKIRQLDLATAEVTTLAGSKQWGFVNGIGEAARFEGPWGLWLAGSVVYIADSGNLAIPKLDLLTGEVTTFVDQRHTLSLCGDGSYLYTISCGGSCIAAIDMASGIVAVIAGGNYPGTTDGIGTAAQLYSLSGIWGESSYRACVILTRCLRDMA